MADLDYDLFLIEATGGSIDTDRECSICFAWQEDGYCPECKTQTPPAPFVCSAAECEIDLAEDNPDFLCPECRQRRAAGEVFELKSDDDYDDEDDDYEEDQDIEASDLDEPGSENPAAPASPD